MNIFIYYVRYDRMLTNISYGKMYRMYKSLINVVANEWFGRKVKGHTHTHTQIQRERERISLPVKSFSTTIKSSSQRIEMEWINCDRYVCRKCGIKKNIQPTNKITKSNVYTIFYLWHICENCFSALTMNEPHVGHVIHG